MMHQKGNQFIPNLDSLQTVYILNESHPISRSHLLIQKSIVRNENWIYFSQEPALHPWWHLTFFFFFNSNSVTVFLSKAGSSLTQARNDNNYRLLYVSLRNFLFPLWQWFHLSESLRRRASRSQSLHVAAAKWARERRANQSVASVPSCTLNKDARRSDEWQQKLWLC